uniref:Uncharacterized protein n=1 Tax=Physcomitrium patens TaxID=3218 RepID=A0A2K1IBE5_PHYPA|nr:hypothetical protein PHYPA_030094 [Physcomitrium patens]
MEMGTTYPIHTRKAHALRGLGIHQRNPSERSLFSLSLCLVVFFLGVFVSRSHTSPVKVGSLYEIRPSEQATQSSGKSPLGKLIKKKQNLFIKSTSNGA